MITVKQLSGGYGDVPIVKNVSFTVEKGQSTWYFRPEWKREIDVIKSNEWYITRN